MYNTSPIVLDEIRRTDKMHKDLREAAEAVLAEAEDDANSWGLQDALTELRRVLAQ